jgi:hypothetical protein
MRESELVDHETVRTLSSEHPVLLVCLRHLGCAFAREALGDLQAQRTAIEARGVRLVLAHLEEPETAGSLLQRYGLGDVCSLSDPSARVYTSCGLERGRVRQLASLRVLWRWAVAALAGRHGAGWTGCDVRQMPGVFLVDRGRIVRAFRHRTSADRPDYVALCSR